MKLLSVARKKHGEYHAHLSRYFREAAYISRQAVESSAGKDIRIYRMTDWFLRKYDEARKVRLPHYLIELQSRYYKEQEELARRSHIMGDEYVEEQNGKEGIFHE